jgi:hypothetical protein
MGRLWLVRGLLYTSISSDVVCTRDWHATYSHLCGGGRGVSLVVSSTRWCWAGHFKGQVLVSSRALGEGLCVVSATR